MPPDPKITRLPEAILFDWDGTLVSTFDLLFQAHNYVREKFDKELWDESSAKKNIRLSAREAFPLTYGSQSPQAFELYYEFIRSKHLDLINNFEGAADLLKYVRSRSIRTGVVSNKRQDILDREVDYLGWSDFFNTVVGAGRAEKDKPDPAPLLMALEEMSVLRQTSTSGNIWYIGDTSEDMACARSAGITPVFITHGFGRSDEIKEPAPPKSFASLEDCRLFLERF